MKLVFVSVSRQLPPWLTGVVEDYKKKISYWFPVEVIVLKSDQKKSEEGMAILKLLKTDDYLVACDEGGREFNSKEFAQTFEKILNAGKKRIIVIIGGAYGLEEDVLGRANLKLSLSAFTLNHHMALAVICEQTYRAMTILKGIKYHNE